MTEHERAIIIVGEAPGRTEDLKCRPFVGKAGRMLREAYIDFFDLTNRADVYLSNAVRCRPPQNKEPNKTQIKTCQGYLLADIRTLQELYAEVIVLAVGASALQSITGGSLKKWLSRQGDTTDFTQVLKHSVKVQLVVLEIATGLTTNEKKKDKLAEWVTKAVSVSYPKPCRVFATYHPAYILRNPSAGLAVHAHMNILRDFLDGNLKMELEGDLAIHEAPLPPEYSIPRLAFDLETYGLFKDGPAQTMFHPLKMETYDFVDRASIIRTAALTWRDPMGDLKHAIFLMDRSDHRRRLWAWFKKVRSDRTFEFLLGQNLNYDLVCLRHCYPECKAWVDYPLPVMDTIITNYLHDEGRPEKSLKNLAPLFRITKYDLGPEVKRFENNLDRKAWQYNCQDTFATYRLQEKLEEAIRQFYGQTTAKLTPYCMNWYTELLWLLVWMTETGLRMDEDRLRSLFLKTGRKRDKLITYAKNAWEMPLEGKGSEIAKRSMMTEAIQTLDELGIPEPKLEKTEALGLISFSVENRNALLEAMRRDGNTRNTSYYKLIVAGRYQDSMKLMTAYLMPILHGRGAKHDDHSPTIINGVVYPSWFPVPSEYEDGSRGGTKQARIVCKGPAAQTFPKEIKTTITCRFPGGYLIWFDYSQIELRIAALLSNDPVLFAEYQGKPDLHTKTARLIFGDKFVDDYIAEHGLSKWKDSLYRQAGKTQNFLMVNRGGAERFRVSLMTDVGLHYPIEKCQAAIDAFWRRHTRYDEWHHEMANFVRRHGYFELPLIGQSRLFLGGKKAREMSLPEIANLPIQAVAAVLMQSAQFHLWWSCKKVGLRAVVPINVYDAAAIEVPPKEIFAVRRIMGEVLPNPPFYADLCAHLGRRLPMEYDVREKKLCPKI
jgi:uracil-DNA glycosylase family 4